MMHVGLTVNGAEGFRRTLNDMQRQMPFVLSKAANRAAFEARDLVMDRNRQAFIIRRDWTVRGWRVRLSHKSQTPVTAALYLDPSRGFLAKFEEGGLKTAASGASLSVPLALRTNKRARIPDALKVRALRLRAVRTKAGKVQLKGEQGAFIVRAGGRTLVLQRQGRRGVRALWVFKRAVQDPPILRFFPTASAYITNEWRTIAAEALAEALRSAR